MGFPQGPPPQSGEKPMSSEKQLLRGRVLRNKEKRHRRQLRKKQVGLPFVTDLHNAEKKEEMDHDPTEGGSDWSGVS